MESFFKIASALKILLAELVVVFFFPVTIAGIITEIRSGIFPPYSDLDGVGEWLMALIGPLFMAWVLYDIFRPRVKDQVSGIFFRIKFRFCSTHPSYILIDLITIVFAWCFLWLGVTGEFDKSVFWLVLAIAITFPVLRVAAWYLLQLKIQDLETRDAYKPALWVFGIFAVIFGGAMIFWLTL